MALTKKVSRKQRFPRGTIFYRVRFDRWFNNGGQWNLDRLEYQSGNQCLRRLTRPLIYAVKPEMSKHDNVF